MSRRWAVLIAIAVSFGAYLIPLFHVHAGLVPLGIVVLGAAEPSVFSAAMLLAALTIQGAIFALTYWALRGFRWWKGAAVIAAAPLLFFGANVLLLYLVPLMVLVERDSRPETGDLERLCSVPKAILAQVHSGTDLALERAGEAWVIRQNNRLRARLVVPGCQLVDVAAPPVGSTMDHVAPGGTLLFRRDNGDLAHVAPGGASPVTLEAPTPGKYWSPILSNAGGTLAWIDRQPVERGPRPYRLRLRRIGGGAVDGAQDETVVLDLPPRGQFEVIGADVENGRFTLARFRNSVLVVDRQGRTIAGPISPPGIYNARWGFRWVGSGWVAWDGYREEGRSRIVWSLPGGTGESIVPKGRKINSLSVDPDARYVAFSLATGLSIASTKSATVLLRLSDGQELFRRYHPTSTRTRVAFLGTDHLAMTRYEGGQDVIDVYRVP